MHILHLETGRHLYGGPRQVLLLMRELKVLGVRSTLACPTASAIATAAAAEGVEVVTHEIGGDLDVSAVAFLTTLLRRLRPDLVHVHSRRGADFFGGLAAGMARLPAVLTRRVDNPDTPVVGSLKYRAYDRVVAISSAVHAQLRAQGVPEAQLRIIPSSVDAGACLPTWTRERFLGEFGLPANAIVAGVVAQLIPRKGHEHLLAAWPKVLERCADARLLVFGAGPLDAALRARGDFGGTVHYAGFRDDLREFVGRLDVLVHPALREGLGVAVLEAQAAGVPVVGFAAGGVSEAVADGITGILVPPGDEPALANAIVRLLASDAERQALGRAGAARIREQFSPERMAGRYKALYRQVLEEIQT